MRRRSHYTQSVEATSGAPAHYLRMDTRSNLPCICTEDRGGELSGLRVQPVPGSGWLSSQSVASYGDLGGDLE
jgi:hypothetical protein